MDISKSIRKALAENGAKQKDLGDYIKVDRKSVSRYATGLSTPTTKSLSLIAEFFDMKVSEFIALGEL